MTQAVAELIKDAGFKSVKEFAGLVGYSPRTMNDWPRERIEEYLVYAKIKREINAGSEKARIILALLS